MLSISFLFKAMKLCCIISLHKGGACMPNIITHKIFAEEVLKKLDNADIRRVIERNLQLYYIGSNGPDFLFFYQSNWKRSSQSGDQCFLSKCRPQHMQGEMRKRQRTHDCLYPRSSLSLGVGYECTSVYFLSDGKLLRKECGTSSSL